MKRPSRRTRLSDTTMLKNGRPLEPPRESRMTTMIYPWVVRRTQKRPVHSVLSALRHATWPPGQRHAEKPTIIARSYFFYTRPTRELLHDHHPPEPRPRYRRNHSHLRPSRPARDGHL